VVSGVVDLVGNTILASLEVGCILAVASVHLLAFSWKRFVTCLGCDDELVSDASFLRPLANELFGCFVLARVKCELMDRKVGYHYSRRTNYRPCR